MLRESGLIQGGGRGGGTTGSDLSVLLEATNILGSIQPPSCPVGTGILFPEAKLSVRKTWRDSFTAWG